MKKLQRLFKVEVRGWDVWMAMGCLENLLIPWCLVAGGYDLVVVGGGAAGFAAIVKYRELLGFERKIAMVTRGPMGGRALMLDVCPLST